MLFPFTTLFVALTVVALISPLVNTFEVPLAVKLPPVRVISPFAVSPPTTLKLLLEVTFKCGEESGVLLIVKSLVEATG